MVTKKDSTHVGKNETAEDEIIGFPPWLLIKILWGAIKKQRWADLHPWKLWSNWSKAASSILSSPRNYNVQPRWRIFVLHQCFSNLKVYSNYLGIFLICTSLSSRSVMAPENLFLTSFKVMLLLLPGNQTLSGKEWHNRSPIFFFFASSVVLRS